MKIKCSLTLPIISALSCAACYSTPEPPATLNFTAFAIKGDGYELTFESDTDFFAPYWVRGRRPVIGRSLSCSLDDDTDFSVKHTLRRFMQGNVYYGEPKAVGQQTVFTYKVLLDFEETINEGSSSQVLDAATVNQLLAGRSAIPCKLVMTIFWARPYYSKTMLVPVKALLDGMNH